MPVLIVQSDLHVASMIKKNLENFGFVVDIVQDAHPQVPSMIDQGHHELILVDLDGLQGMGMSIADFVQNHHADRPFLLMGRSAWAAALEKDFGRHSESYLIKPFSFAKLLSRIRTRLSQPAVPQTRIVFADLSFFPFSGRVRRQNRDVYLTRKEAALLELFLRHPNQVLTRRRIAEAVWEDPSVREGFTNIIDVYVNYLRKKMDRDFEPKLIHTVRGQGYVLKDPGTGVVKEPRS